ncbi:hypothetical protein ACSSS7_006497 [Eimeria intestinalis]
MMEEGDNPTPQVQRSQDAAPRWTYTADFYAALRRQPPDHFHRFTCDSAHVYSGRQAFNRRLINKDLKWECEQVRELLLEERTQLLHGSALMGPDSLLAAYTYEQLPLPSPCMHPAAATTTAPATTTAAAIAAATSATAPPTAPAAVPQSNSLLSRQPLQKKTVTDSPVETPEPLSRLSSPSPCPSSPTAWSTASTDSSRPNGDALCHQRENQTDSHANTKLSSNSSNSSSNSNSSNSNSASVLQSMAIVLDHRRSRLFSRKEAITPMVYISDH